MKICLSIETTQSLLGLGLYRFSNKGKPQRIAIYYRQPTVKQSDALIPELNKLMRKSKTTPRRLAMIAVDIGPGSFTGVRVGLTVARTMAQALEIPVVGVNSLEAIAWSVRSPDGAIVVPSLPATSGEFFYAAYREGKPIVKPAWGSEKNLSDCRKKFPRAIQASAPPHPDAIAALAIERYQNSASPRRYYFEEARPLYLQPSWAERSKTSA